MQELWPGRGEEEWNKWAYWEARRNEGKAADDFFRRISPKARQMETWVELVVKCNMSTSICEDPTMRKHVKEKGISRKTLRKYLIKLADIVGLVISDQIGPGNCIADGWSCAGIHYFAIYHQWPSLAADGETIEVKRALLIKYEEACKEIPGDVSRREPGLRTFLPCASNTH
eukprot:scaffold7007_cov146-Amphora_coffeaeformis.AAC.1